MTHIPPLISDLALILGAAAVTSLIFKGLKQPVVLGYILAGLLVGPNFDIFPTVVELDGIRTWAEIGVIFLLFSLGLEFSFKRLLAVGGVAVIIAISGVGLTMLTGYNIGRMLGWEFMDRVFFGGILGIASTTIIIRAFDELKVRTQKFTEIVTGVLIIEDLVAVVLMVLLSTMSISRTFEGMEMIGSVMKLVFFLVLWFVSGIFFLPSLLKWARNHLTDEMLLILSLALCFLMVVLADKAGFSAALGAFIMGSILAETTKGVTIEHILTPVKNLFGAIFFVSVGMLIDLNMIIEHTLPIMIGTLVLLFCKPTFITLAALLTGQPIRIALQSGMSLSQIGEFSFIIATLGLSLNVTSEFLYPIAVAVSVITTFTTPYMIRFSTGVAQFAEQKLPQKWVQRFNSYVVGAQSLQDEGAWKKLIRFYVSTVLVFSVICVAIILLSTKYMLPYFSTFKGGRELGTLCTLIILSPFLLALAFRRTKREIYTTVWVKPLQRGPLIILMTSRVIFAILLLGFLFQKVYSTQAALLGLLVTCGLLFLFRNQIRVIYRRLETRFLSNYNEKQKEEEESSNKALAPWDTHLAEFIVDPASPLVGKSLLASRIREQFGVNIAIIERGNMVLNVPDRNEMIFPNDRISVIGTDEQLKNFSEFLDKYRTPFLDSEKKPKVVLTHFEISENSPLKGKDIRNSGIRQGSQGLVVGIERKGEHILNPESDLVFEAGDVVWIVGSEKRLMVLAKENGSVSRGAVKS